MTTSPTRHASSIQPDSMRQRHSSLLRLIGRMLCFLVICGATAFPVLAQNIQFTQGRVSAGLDNVFQIPIHAYPGRGSASLPITLNYSSRVWRIAYINKVTAIQGGYQVRRPVTEAIYAEHSRAGWTTTLDIPRVEWPRLNDLYSYTGKPCNGGSPCQGYPPAPLFRVSRVFIHMPDGSTHELRESDTPYQDTGAIDMSGKFYAVDGSRLRFDSVDVDTGTLFLPDGTRYVIDGSTTKYIDRHGNTLNYNDTTRQWTDTMGREFGIPLPAVPLAQDYTYVIPGFDGATLTYTFRFQTLANTLTPNAQGQTPALKNLSSHYLPYPYLPPNQNFPSSTNFPQPASGESLFSTYVDEEEGEPETTYVVGRGQVAGYPFNPVVLAEIIYPNGMKYKFSYNIYGEIDKVTYPTGAHELYQYNVVPALGDLKEPYSSASRAVTQRQLSADGTGSSYATWQYNVATYWTDATVPMHSMRIKTSAPDNTTTVVYKHDIKASFVPFDYEDPRNGNPFDERVHGFNNPDGTPGPMLRRKLTSWEQTTNTVPPRTTNLGDVAVPAYRNVRVNKEVNLILDTGGNANALAKTTTFQYDATHQLTTGLDLTATTESQFASLSQSVAQTGAIETIAPTAGTIVRSGEHTYLNSSAYLELNLLGLVTVSLVKDANGNPVAKTETFYDGEGVLPYSDVPYPSNPIDWTNPGEMNPRGNVTKVRRYYDLANNLYLETRFQFDKCGNLVNSWNERNILSKIEYSSDFRRAYATKSITAIPDPTGQYGSNVEFTSSSSFDFKTGLVLTTTDINGQVTHFSYANDQGQLDPLYRLRKVTRPDGGWTKIAYNDTVGNLYSYTETKQDAARVSKIYQTFDALGRASRALSYESGTTYLITDKQYDLMGRVWRVSNPYRGALGSAVNPSNHWTSSTFDALGRATAVTFSDTQTSWTAQTEYQGIYTTFTDQALKKRRQKVDSLGRVVRVDEPGGSGALGDEESPEQPTHYEYDVSGNLVHVTQGTGSQVQHRYFKYDALSRLIYERQVEHNPAFVLYDSLTTNSQWTRKIMYDETIDNVSYKGLMTGTYDARVIHTQYEYDQLNRVRRISYSDGTPTLTNHYDQARSGYFNKGKLTEVVTAALGDIPQTAQAYDFDFMGRAARQTQTVDAYTYTLRYAYNLGGQLVQQIYPSGRAVNFGYDEASRLSNVNGGQGHSFINAMNYTPQGTLSSATVGNDVLYSYGYNSRLQLDTLQASRNGSVLQKYEYKYGKIQTDGTIDETRNNGQIGRIEGWIGTQKQWRQSFDYDHLGRLKEAGENRGDNNLQTYKLTYRYDIFGNRFQHQADNPNNPFTQKWVEEGDIAAASNRYTSNIAYDNAGNIMADPRFRNLEYLYDANGRQKQASQPGGVNPIKAIYDGAGQRVATKSNGVLMNIMVYDMAGKLVAEYGQNAPSTAAIQYPFADHQGSTRLVTDRAGAIVARHDFQPFGEELAPNVGMRTSAQGYGLNDKVRQKFVGMETDEATNMSHTLWRKYDAQSGRWTSPDPYSGSMTIADPQSFNRFQYVNNDPVNLTDPTGLAVQVPYNGADIGWERVARYFWGLPVNAVRSRLGGSRNIALAMRRHDILRETGYDPLFRQFRGEVDVKVYIQGSGWIDIRVTNPYIDNIIASYNASIQAFRQDVANGVAALKGLPDFIEKVEPNGEGYRFVARPGREDDLKKFLSSTDFKNGGLHVLHSDDIDCKSGKCDWRSLKQTYQLDLGWGKIEVSGSLQVVFDGKRGFFDFDQYNPYEGIKGFFNHALHDVITSSTVTGPPLWP